MCTTCGCGQPFNKHQEKDIQAANRKYANPKIKFEAIKAKLKSKRTWIFYAAAETTPTPLIGFLIPSTDAGYAADEGV